jgi:hypothetical protein
MKSKSTSLSRNVDMYSKAQLETIKEGIKEYLLFFGYTDHPTD